MNTSQNPAIQRILVPLDGSARAEEALPLAAKISQTSGATLLLVRVVLPSSYTPYFSWGMVPMVDNLRDVVVDDAQEYLNSVIEREHLDRFSVQTDVQIGGAANTIIDMACAHHIDLIVMRSHGETGFKRWLFGSVAQQIIRYCPIPVLVLRDGCPPSGLQQEEPFHAPRILVALDGSEQAEATLVPAARLCSAFAFPSAGSLHLTRVVQRLSSVNAETSSLVDQLNEKARVDAQVYLARIQERFRVGDLAQYHLSVTTSVVSYDDIREIARSIVQEGECIGDGPGYTGCDIVAMATHDRHGISHLLAESFTEDVFDKIHRPMLVIHCLPTGERGRSLFDREHALGI